MFGIGSHAKKIIRSVSNKLFHVKLAFCVPSVNQIQTHLTAREKYTLYCLARKQEKSHCFVEVGSFLGASALCIATGMPRNDSMLYCVDTWNDGVSAGRSGIYGEFLSNIDTKKDQIVPLRGKSVDIASGFSRTIDFLIIDGDHKYEGVKADIDVWWPILRAGGLIAMHDIGSVEFGVIKVVNEFIHPRTRGHGWLPNLFWGYKK